MGMLTSDLQMVLELEREGERRIEDAEAAARRLLEAARQRAQDLRRETERGLAREREERLARLEQELAERSGQLEERFAAQKEALNCKAQRNRDGAVAQVLAWLSGEGR